MKKTKPKKEQFDPWLAFAGCIILGVGIGTFYGQVVVGSTIGVGVGFLVVTFLQRKRSSK